MIFFMKNNLMLGIRFPLLFIFFCSYSLLSADEGKGFISIFDGKTLKGWRKAPETSYEPWSVKDGVIRGEGEENRLVYLVYSGDENLKSFELKFRYKMVTKGNTGVEVRTRIDKTGKRPFEGYHADLGHIGIGPGLSLIHI